MGLAEAAGARNKEIAERLVISEKTAKNTLSRVYGKLGAASRAEAVARGRSLGVLPLDDAHFDEGPHPRPLSHGSAKGG